MRSFSISFPIFLLLYVAVHLCAPAASSLADEPKPFALPRAPPSAGGLELIDPSLPPALPAQPPTCSLLVLQQDFADTVGSPPASANYTPPAGCPAPWTRVVLELSASASAAQQDRVAAVWLDGAEVLRTTTPMPVVPGAFWRVHKDVTRYTALLRRLTTGGSGGVVSMMLENSNALLPGVYSVNISLHFYRGAIPNHFTARPSVKGFYGEPADVILPVSRNNGYYCGGFWFRIDNESHVPFSSVTIPRNTYRAVLEVFASNHGDDELWFMNPLRGGLAGGPEANGGFRQLYATIDGQFVGGHVPFPVMYPGSINPFFWSPVAAIGAFDMPSYDLDVTPFLALLLDGQPHEVGLGVRSGRPYWLATANLHLWVDARSDVVAAAVVELYAPRVRMNRQAEWQVPDGQSEVDAEGATRFVGWASSSKGNITTTVRQKMKFRSQVAVQNRGAVRQVEFTSKTRSAVGRRRGHEILGRVQVFAEAPVQVQVQRARAAAAGSGGGEWERTRLFHELQEVVNLNADQVVSSSALTGRQDAQGEALVHEGKAVWGSGSTKSSYKYRDASTCYLRTVNTDGGAVKFDVSSPSCAAVNES